MALNGQLEKWLKVFIRSQSVVIWPNKKKLQFWLLVLAIVSEPNNAVVSNRNNSSFFSCPVSPALAPGDSERIL